MGGGPGPTDIPVPDPPGDMPGTGGETRLKRSLTLSDAVAVGLGSMIGARIFTALAPAAAAAGAGLVVGAVLVATVLPVDLRPAIGFSSFCVLLYYAVTNLAACRLKPGERLYSRVLPAVGLPGCVVLAFTLPLESVIAGSLVILAGLVLLRLHRRPAEEPI